MSLHLYLLHTENPDDTVLMKIIPKLPHNSQEKILKNRSLKEQWRATLSELLLRNVLAQELGFAEASIKIEIDSQGKPFLKGEKRHFNLSHSEAMIVIATDDTPIGIDVEYVQPLDDLEHLLVNFSQEEQQAYQSRTPEQRVDFFYDLWTLKESYVKAVGKGLSYELDSFTIMISKKGTYLFKETGSLDTAWYFKRYTFGTKYKCAICARQNQFPEEALIVKVEDLVNLYC